jgi:uncharacterized protein YecT (DUF1311 family)
MNRCAILAAAILLPLAARAGVDPEIVYAVLRVTKGIPREVIVENYDDCDSGITYPMKVCFAYRWMAEDVRMNREYKKALAVAKKVGADDSLRAAQRSWVVFRDTECVFQGHIEAGGGSAEGVVVLACKQTVTRLRADSLAQLVQMYSSGARQ